MGKYSIQYFDLDTGLPAATVASYGITLNAAATRLISAWAYAKIGVDRARRVIVLEPHNNDQDGSGSLRLRGAGRTQDYLRISNRDLVRAIAGKCELDLRTSCRYMVEWDAEDKVLVILLHKLLSARRPRSTRDGQEQ